MIRMTTLLLTLAAIASSASAVAVNHARTAIITTSSTHSAGYSAKYVADGVVPKLFGRAEKTEWAAKGNNHKKGVTLTMAWKTPIRVAEIVYYGRCAFAVEGFKGYQIFLDGAKTPAIKGMLKSGVGPQTIKLPKAVMAKTLAIKFTSSFGGSNPGAAEIMVYSVSPPQKSLGTFKPLAPFTHGQPLSAKGSLVPESPDLAKTLRAGKLGFTKLLVVKRHPYTISHVYTYHVESFVPGGGIYILTPGKDGPTQTELFDAGKGEVMDLTLSYDGKEILFSYKRTDGTPSQQNNRNHNVGPSRDPKTMYQIYRMSIVPGSKPKQLTHGAYNNFNPCWLPDGTIAFLSDRKDSFAYCFVTSTPLLHRMEGDGSKVRRISHGYLNDFTPSVLNDGRIIYSRWEYVDRPAIPIQSLWTINPDGTGASGFFGNRCIEPGTFMEAKSIGKTGKVLCVLAGHNGSCRGALAIIDTSFCSNADKGITNITPEIPLKKTTTGNGNGLCNRGPYENPFPIDETHFLTSRAGTILLRDFAGESQVTIIKPDGRMGYYSPTPIRAIKPPPVIRSLLPKGKVKPWATIFMQDVYNGLEPDVKRGEIKQVCVVQEIEKGDWAAQRNSRQNIAAFGFQFPLVSCGATYAPKKIWGYADVLADGSAHFKVPSGVPIYFLALDAQGRAVQRMRSLTHFQPGELQSCVGCHADRNYVIANAPRRRAMAAKRPPQELAKPEWGRRNFDYSKIVQPVFDTHCIKCHNAKTQPKGFDLTGDKTDFFNVSYDTLARRFSVGEWNYKRYGIKVGSKYTTNPYVKWISTINGTEWNILLIKPRTWGSPASKLTTILTSGHPDKDGKKRIALSDLEQRRVFAWMDVNVPYYSDSTTSYPDRLGCRRILPENLEAVLANVAKRRCAECHKGGKIPRKFYTRITNPQDNNFLLAPLAKAAGGTEACGKAIFKTTADPDYQKILTTFAPLTKMIQAKPRLDMPGATPSACKTCPPVK